MSAKTLETTKTTKTTKLSIPHPKAPDIKIVGLLEQHEPDAPTQGRKLGLILHGVMGHKDYLFQKRLAYRMPVDSFRFDFRANHETPGRWSVGGLAEDIEDLDAVAEYLRSQLGYKVDVLVGHSRASLVAIRWLSTRPEYAQSKILESGGSRWEPAFKEHGYAEWNVRVAGKQVVGIIRPPDVEAFVNWDTSLVWDRFPQHIHVLTIHGVSDSTVPVFDAIIYARAFGARNPGTHTLHLIEDAGHNFTGHYDEVKDTVVEWYSFHLNGANVEGRSGIWATGVRGKL